MELDIRTKGIKQTDEIKAHLFQKLKKLDRFTIISLFLGFSRIVGPLKYQGLNYNDKLKISRTFKDTDARIADGIFISSNTYIIELSDVNVAFIKTGGAISELSGNAVNIIILGDKIYYVVGVVNARVFKFLE